MSEYSAYFEIYLFHGLGNDEERGGVDGFDAVGGDFCAETQRDGHVSFVDLVEASFGGDGREE